MMKTAIVTAGGTVESIDDVRRLSVNSVEGTDLERFSRLQIENTSTGAFGKAIAYALANRGVQTTLIGQYDLVKSISDLPPNLRLVSFRSFRDLEQAIRTEIERSRVIPDAFFMAAAVSDYSPIPTEGKLSSSADELTITLKKNPKLLDSLRALLGNYTCIVGFKLLSGVSKETLIEAAQKQNERADIDLTIANDLQEIDYENGIHPVELVGHGGSFFAADGAREEVAEEICHEVYCHWVSISDFL